MVSDQGVRRADAPPPPVSRPASVGFDRFDGSQKAELAEHAERFLAGQPEWLRSYDFMMADIETAVLARDENGRIVGTCSTYDGSRLLNDFRVRTVDGQRVGGTVRDVTVAVEPDAAGQGVARGMVAQVEADLLADGGGWMVAEIAAANTRSVGLFERCGYRRADRPGSVSGMGLWVKHIAVEPTTVSDFAVGELPAHRHANGGGMVADRAVVADDVYVAPGAKVLGGTVTGGRIEHHAVVVDGTITGGLVAGGRVEGGTITGGSVFDGVVKGGVVSGGEVRGGLIVGGEVRGGTVRDGVIRDGKIVDVDRPA